MLQLALIVLGIFAVLAGIIPGLIFWTTRKLPQRRRIVRIAALCSLIIMLLLFLGYVASLPV